eukprot:1160628-Pelagomonas_calceolata.AAC.22
MNVPKRQRCPQLGMGSLLEPPPRRSGRRQRTGSPSRLLSSSAQMQSANHSYKITRARGENWSNHDTCCGACQATEGFLNNLRFQENNSSSPTRRTEYLSSLLLVKEPSSPRGIASLLPRAACNNMYILKCIIVQGSRVCSWTLCAYQQWLQLMKGMGLRVVAHLHMQEQCS